MKKTELARQAFDECCRPETTVRYGVKRGFPFWNMESTQFMYGGYDCPITAQDEMLYSRLMLGELLWGAGLE